MEYENATVDELMKWVWKNDKPSAASNCEVILREHEKRYDKGKSFWKRLKCLFV